MSYLTKEEAEALLKKVRSIYSYNTDIPDMPFKEYTEMIGDMAGSLVLMLRPDAVMPPDHMLAIVDAVPVYGGDISQVWGFKACEGSIMLQLPSLYKSYQLLNEAKEQLLENVKQTKAALEDNIAEQKAKNA